MIGPMTNPPIKPRKIPRQKRSAETVEIIVEAAARILETKGLAAYTTNAVAERAGVSIGSLYQYFPNKDALTAALIERETGSLLSDVADASSEALCHEALRRMIKAAVTHQMRRPILARVLDFEEARLAMVDRDRRVTSQIIAALTKVLTREQESMRAPHVLLAQDILTITRGLVDAAGNRGETDAQALQNRVERAVFGYLFYEAPTKTGL